MPGRPVSASWLRSCQAACEAECSADGCLPDFCRTKLNVVGSTLDGNLTGTATGAVMRLPLICTKLPAALSALFTTAIYKIPDQIALHCLHAHTNHGHHAGHE
jgi:hypothetical protein